MSHANFHDVVRNGRCSIRRLHANPPVPGRKNPEPDLPSPPGQDDEDAPAPDEEDSERHRPGRDERLTLRARSVGVQ